MLHLVMLFLIHLSVCSYFYLSLDRLLDFKKMLRGFSLFIQFLIMTYLCDLIFIIVFYFVLSHIIFLILSGTKKHWLVGRWLIGFHFICKKLVINATNTYNEWNEENNSWVFLIIFANMEAFTWCVCLYALR